MGYGQNIIGANNRSAGGLRYRVIKQGDHFTVELDLPTKNGKVLVCRGACSLREAAHDMGYSDCDLDALRAIGNATPANVGAEGTDVQSFRTVFSWFRRSALASTDAQWRAAFAQWGFRVPLITRAQMAGKLGPRLFLRAYRSVSKESREQLRDLAGVKREHNLLTRVGIAIHGAARSKAFRSALNVAASVVSNPVVLGALGVVTGGAALPALAGAKAALDLAHLAKSAPRTPEGAAAKKLMRVAHVVARRASGELEQPARVAPIVAPGAYQGARITPAQRARIEVLAKVVKTAKARRAVMAPARVQAVKRSNARHVLPAPKLADIVKYTVALQRTA